MKPGANWRWGWGTTRCGREPTTDGQFDCNLFWRQGFRCHGYHRADVLFGGQQLIVAPCVCVCVYVWVHNRLFPRNRHVAASLVALLARKNHGRRPDGRGEQPGGRRRRRRGRDGRSRAGSVGVARLRPQHNTAAAAQRFQRWEVARATSTGGEAAQRTGTAPSRPRKVRSLPI